MTGELNEERCHVPQCVLQSLGLVRGQQQKLCAESLNHSVAERTHPCSADCTSCFTSPLFVCYEKWAGFSLLLQIISPLRPKWNLLIQVWFTQVWSNMSRRQVKLPLILRWYSYSNNVKCLDCVTKYAKQIDAQDLSSLCVSWVVIIH